jgi:hypothetical protein
LTFDDGVAGFIDTGFGGRVPDAVDGWMQPELEEDVVGFESRVCGEFGAPVAFAGLLPEEYFGGRLKCGVDVVAEVPEVLAGSNLQSTPTVRRRRGPLKSHNFYFNVYKQAEGARKAAKVPGTDYSLSVPLLRKLLLG